MDKTITYPLTFQSAAVANGPGTLADVGGLSTVAVQVVGLAGSTVNFEALAEYPDGTDWVSCLAINMSTGAVSSTATANGVYLVLLSGAMTRFRARISNYGGDTVTVTGRGTVVSPGMILTPLPSGSSLTIVPATSGGLSNFRTLDLQPAAQTVKSSPGQIYGYYVANQSTSWRFVKGYNKTGATQADTPLFTWAIPPSSAAHRSIPQGIPFSTALSLRGTTGVADNDTGAPTANDLVVNLEYF